MNVPYDVICNLPVIVFLIGHFVFISVLLHGYFRAVIPNFFPM